MQAAGTLRGTRTISFLVFLVPLIGYAYSVPLQYLPNIPGYIPVYIRHGDEPLEDINPDLAEAFGEASNSAKTLQLDHTYDHVSNSFKDDDIDALLEESKRKHAYPLHVRATESRSFGNNEANKPKLLTIYELPDDNESRPRRRHRGRSRTTNENWRSAFKISPLSDAEKEELEKLAIEVEKEETKPNELYVLDSKHPPLSSETTRKRHKSHNYMVPVKVQHPLDESSADLSEIHQVPDLPKSSDDHNVITSGAGKKEPPVKEQRPTTILANVDKMSPIDKPDKSETGEVATSKSGIKEPPIKEQRPATILSNVDKISPIDLPDKSETNENKTKDSTEPNDEIAMD